MPTTTAIVDECILLVDGSPSNDETVKKRWRFHVQRAANILWNDRPWPWKVITDAAFPFDPAGDVDLPTDYGSVESRGAGVYNINPRAWLQPMDIGEYNALKNASQIQTMAIGVWTKYAIGPPVAGSPGTLCLWPIPSAAADVGFVYLKRAPRCQLDTIDPGTDELEWIPVQWHDMIQDAAIWRNAHWNASNQEDSEQAFVKLIVDQIRARENTGAQARQQIVPFRRSRRNR